LFVAASSAGLTAMAAPNNISRAPIVPERLRRIDGQGFAFVPNRFLRDGFFASLSRDELALYVLLILAGDRSGVSFYHYDSLCSILGLPLHRYLDARNALIDQDLIAFDGTRFQVLSLPAQPVVRSVAALRSPDDLEARDPATIRATIRDALARGPSRSR
jgi:hypothetical protein